jgi:hypothetical protein
MFRLTNSEANHGEDVKEYYFSTDSTPTHSCTKYLYKYLQPTFNLWQAPEFHLPGKVSRGFILAHAGLRYPASAMPRLPSIKERQR